MEKESKVENKNEKQPSSPKGMDVHGSLEVPRNMSIFYKNRFFSKYSGFLMPDRNFVKL